jgi:alpha-galactosidase
MKCFIAALFLLGPLAASASQTVWLDTLDLSHMRQGYGTPQIDRSIRETPLSVGGVKFKRGVGTHAKSTLWLDLDGSATRFEAMVGLDDAAHGPGSIEFKILGDGRNLFDSGVMRSGNAAKHVDVGLAGIKTALLEVTAAGDGIGYDHADWAQARFIVNGKAPRTIEAPGEERVILTPKPGRAPRLNGPTIYGCRPGHPFIYRIPAQGQRPMVFSADSLPDSLSLDSASGIITGSAPPRGKYRVRLHATNQFGQSSRLFRIVSGDTLALTPPMGWNHWYAFYDHVTDEIVRQAADVMISSGMADVGYQYANIDDCWMNSPHNRDPLRVGPLRDANGTLIPNHYFPDMKALTDYIHAKGLKAGIYISPGPLTCGGFAGSFRHEAHDARTFADWGFDFLKYDWCSYGRIASGQEPAPANYPTWGKGRPTLAGYMYPYQLMGRLLKEQNRDIVFNLCQYGMGNVWEWGAKAGGNCWRTAGDLGFELNRFFEVALKNAEHRAWSRPGGWNDPDYLQIGWTGDAHAGGTPKPFPLEPTEQYAYMSLWALMAAPLVYSGDMSRLDDFTLNILCNPEVIDVDQDALGQSAAVARLNNSTFLMVKDLEDGSKAVGLFNQGEFPAKVTAPWSVIGVCGEQKVRDLWREKDLGLFEGAFTAEVPRRGVVLVRVVPK